VILGRLLLCVGWVWGVAGVILGSSAVVCGLLCMVYVATVLCSQGFGVPVAWWCCILHTCGSSAQVQPPAAVAVNGGELTSLLPVECWCMVCTSGPVRSCHALLKLLSCCDGSSGQNIDVQVVHQGDLLMILYPMLLWLPGAHLAV